MVGCCFVVIYWDYKENTLFYFSVEKLLDKMKKLDIIIYKFSGEDPCRWLSNTFNDCNYGRNDGNSGSISSTYLQLVCNVHNKSQRQPQRFDTLVEEINSCGKGNKRENVESEWNRTK